MSVSHMMSNGLHCCGCMVNGKLQNTEKHQASDGCGNVIAGASKAKDNVEGQNIMCNCKVM